jgi:hypothetical protein
MNTTARHPRWIASVAVTICILCPTAVRAQGTSPNETRRISVDDRELAAEAYDQGTAAYLAKDYERAAHWFERAYRLVPTSTALLQAVRASSKSDEPLRAATLALELRDLYPTDARANHVANAVIGSVRATSVLVEVTCNQQCTLELDGSLLQHPKLFVTPDVEHFVKASFANGEISTSVQGVAGETCELSLSAPVPPPPPPIPRWAFFSSLGATVALGAVTIWSGIDANKGVSAYESAARTASSPGINDGSSPTPAEQAQALLDEGQSKERRTNILIGVTAAMATTTAIIGVFTNWKRESRQTAPKRIEAAVGMARDGGAFTVKGRF